MTFLLLKERASLSRLFHLLEKRQHKKKIRYWLQKWNMRRVSFQYNCNFLLRTLVCKNGFKIQRYCYVMRKCHIRDFLVHTRLCLKIKFRPVIELIACTFRLHYMALYWVLTFLTALTPKTRRAQTAIPLYCESGLTGSSI